MQLLDWFVIIFLVINGCLVFFLGTYLYKKQKLMGMKYPMLAKYHLSFRDLINQIPGNLYWKDLDGKLIAANKEHNRSFSTKDDLRGVTEYDLFPKGYADKIRALDLEVIRTGRMQIGEELATTEDGRTQLYLSHKAPLYNSRSELVGIIGTSLDISNAKKVELDRLCRDIERLRGVEKALILAKESAEKASRAKSEFIAVMSHEFRTPLTGMLGMLDILLREDVSELQRQEYLQNINAVSRHLLSLINNILDFAKMEAKKFRLSYVAFDLKYEMEEVLRILSSQALAKNIQLDFDYPDDFPTKFCGDPKSLSQVLMNIIGNALKFTNEGCVKVEVVPQESSGDDAHFWIAIEDTGIGISSEKAEKIFEAFEQADISHTRHYGGTGLGLAVARRLIEFMGGKIWVESILGYGAKFYVDLTLDKSVDEPVIQQFSERIAQKVDGSCRVLLVEDDPLVQFVHSHKLEKLGCEVIVVSDGKSALSAYEMNKFDIIFMDIGLPDLSGNEVIRWIRKIEKATGVLTPIVALSAYADEKNREEMLMAGATMTLCKPVESEKLLDVIESLRK